MKFNRRNSASICAVFVCMVVLSAAISVRAADDAQVYPVVIDYELFPGDIEVRDVTLARSPEAIGLGQYFPMVRNVDADGVAQSFEHFSVADRSTSLANWMNVSRAQVQLLPGEQRVLPITFDIHYRAKPGTYHAIVAFPEGHNRAAAEERIDSALKVFVTIVVGDPAKESASLTQFRATSAFFGSAPVTFEYGVENGGDLEVVPRGRILIYDRRGHEVDSLPLNGEGASLAPEESKTLASVWEAASRIGRHKALLVLEYGSGQTASIHDTEFFWVIPWVPLLAVFFVTLFLALYLVSRWHERYAFAHRARIHAWHQEAAEKHSARKQRVKGLPSSPAHSSARAGEPNPTPLPQKPPLRVQGNVVDLRKRDET